MKNFTKLFFVKKCEILQKGFSRWKPWKPQFKLKIWKTINGNDTQIYFRKPTCSAVKMKSQNKMADAYVNSTAVSRINMEIGEQRLTRSFPTTLWRMVSEQLKRVIPTVRGSG